jgi:uncharacterized OsmC-like protein
MDAHELRERQEPLRRRYRDDPKAAATPVRATAEFAGEPAAGSTTPPGSEPDTPGVTTDVAGWAGTVRAGLHPATGGAGADACSGDLLMEALVACVGVTLRSVATARGIAIASATMRAEGSFDARGTLGMDREVPVGVTGVVVTADLVTDADDTTLERLAATTERYCVVGQSLREPPRIEVRRAG